jgi:uncharacterized RmlC-like cupin family protein
MLNLVIQCRARSIPNCVSPQQPDPISYEFVDEPFFVLEAVRRLSIDGRGCQNIDLLSKYARGKVNCVVSPRSRDVRSAQDFAATRMQSSSGGFAMDWAKHGVKIVHSDELDLNTPQTSGMTRAAAITHAGAGANKLWAGTMLVQPDARTGPHHHGELETVLYVVKGRVRMRWGDQLEFSEEAKPGDFIFVPPYVPHQEINASTDEPCEAVVVRDGQDPIVVNLDLRTPEPASAGHPGMPFHPDR